jgi:hypothetical protein
MLRKTNQRKAGNHSFPSHFQSQVGLPSIEKSNDGQVDRKNGNPF